MYRVTIEKTVKEYYLLEADSEEEAAALALEPFVIANGGDLISEEVIEIEEVN